MIAPERRTTLAEIIGWLGPGDRLAVLAAAVLAGGLLWPLTGGMVAAFLAVLAAAAVVLTLVDLRQFVIPDLLSLPLITLGLGFSALQGANALLGSAAAVVILLGMMLLVRRMFHAMRGVEGLGLGDVKLAAAAAAWIGPWHVADYVLAASVTALVHGALLWFARSGLRIPFGAHLAPWLWVFAVAEALGFWM